MLRSFSIPWAADRWFGFDKIEHLIWAYAGAFSLPHLLPWFLALVLVAIAAAVVEIVQWLRWDIWHNDVQNRRVREEYSSHLATVPPRPAFADQPSYRDLVWDAVGLVLGFLAWVVVR